ncbi:unnamed protein product [Toxocara canis]|uniref:VWFA domain-containing protein n=1 Tax=Toxocara canis TaxID=6265 RepID=A0A183UGS6_TOXCA|nr:unnamed protein product [Toxocara canis]
MRVVTCLNFIAGAICIAGIIAGLVIQFLNRKKIEDDSSSAIMFYFTTHIAALSYDEVQADYANVASRIQKQLESALSDSTNKNEKKRVKRETCCGGATVTVLGIAEDPQGGVTVMSGISYTASRAPSVNEIKAKINSIPGTTVVKAIGEDEIILCAHSDTVLLIQTYRLFVAETITTVFHPETTCPPCPSPDACPPTPPCPTPDTKPTIPVGLPCKVDIGILFDSSSAVSRASFQKMTDFVRKQLVPSWIIGPQSTEAVIGAYADSSVAWKSRTFEYADNAGLESDLQDLSREQELGKPSIQRALVEMISTAKNRRKGTKLVTVLFTYTSDAADVDAARKSADELTQNDDTLIVVGVGNGVDMHLLSTLGAFTIQASNFDETTAVQINGAVCIGKPTQPGLPTHSPIVPTFPPQLLCDTDVAVFLDASTAVSEQEYEEDPVISHDITGCYVHYPYDYVVLKEVRFLQEKLSKRWTPNPYWTELAIAAYGSEGAHIYGNFKYETVEDYEHDLENLTNHYPLGSPSFQRYFLFNILACFVSRRRLEKRQPFGCRQPFRCEYYNPYDSHISMNCFPTTVMVPLATLKKNLIRKRYLNWDRTFVV